MSEECKRCGKRNECVQGKHPELWNCAPFNAVPAHWMCPSRAAFDPFMMAFEQAKVGLALVSLEGKFLRINNRFSDIVVTPIADLLEMSFTDVIPAENQAWDLAALGRMAEDRLNEYHTEVRLQRPDGEQLWARLHLSLVRRQDNSPWYVYAQIEDISARKLAEMLREQAEYYSRAVAEQAPHAVLQFDVDGQCMYVNQRWQQLSGRTYADSISLGWTQALHPEERDQVIAAWEFALRTNSSFEMEFRLVHAEGQEAWVYGCTSAIRDPQGEILGYMGTVVDITLRKKYEEDLFELNDQMQHLASQDDLTRLPNRRSLYGQLRDLWDGWGRTDAPLSCILLDIDYFKKINDQFGHEAGDEALREVATTVRSVTRSGDYCGRFGGEEFLVVCPEASLTDVTQVAERIRAAVEELTIPFGNLDLAVTVSLGVAQRQPGDDRPEDMINRADQRLYRAKELGRNQVFAGELSA